MNWNAFKRLFHYLGRYKLRLILVMIAAVLSTLFTVLTPAVTGGITSELYDGVASGSFDWETIVWLLVTLIALYLVAQLFAILQSFSMTKLTACVMETLRGDIDRKMHHLKLDYYDSHILHKLQMFMVSRLLRKTKALPIWQTMIRKSQISNN
ncbi:ABC transporter transmembrane domain-containing protein [Dysosmobacter sp.]|mgnify:CR=1 FL=1|jgi:hypothetical protein|uniref:ABC transporter transmembrane domain-containing protein n=1 Tax=Dysosmobacter sp. TaxID=2591382 RepID=UPI003AB7476D